jgi:hypothetical protein
MSKAIKGAWVEIENEVLSASERAPQIPDDTKKTPLKMWTRGFLVNETARMGDQVSVVTLSDRKAEGKLVDVEPRFKHDFGNAVLELLKTGVEVKKDSNCK